MRRLVASLGLAIAVAAAPAALFVGAAPAAAQRDWTRTVTATPEGGFVMGNPDAPVKVVEFVSLTCSHCSAFAQEGVPALTRDYVRSGRVSLEYRNFVLNIFDVSAALVARCGGAASFFPVADQMLATQEQWLSRFENMSEADRDRLSGLDPPGQLVHIAEVGGLTAMAANHGITAEQARRCLADRAGLERLIAMTRGAVEQHQVSGTPTFLVNGSKVDAHDWQTLEPVIRRAAS